MFAIKPEKRENGCRSGHERVNYILSVLSTVECSCSTCQATCKHIHNHMQLYTRTSDGGCRTEDERVGRLSSYFNVPCNTEIALSYN